MTGKHKGSRDSKTLIEWGIEERRTIVSTRMVTCRLCCRRYNSTVRSSFHQISYNKPGWHNR